jgi:hypothetical protein
MEVDSEILDEFPRFKLVEAIQAADRGDESCPVCKELVSGPEDAAVIAYTAPDCWYYLALAHRRCRRSKMLEDGDPLIDAISPDTFASAWKLVQRGRSPRAVLLWENKTNFDEISSFDDVGSVDGGPGWTGYAMREEGFVAADDDLDRLTAPRPESYRVVEREDGLEIRECDLHGYSFPGTPPDAWSTTATREGAVLLVHGTALQLDHFDPEHFGRRVRLRKVIVGVLPYGRRRGTVLHSLETLPVQRGAENECPPNWTADIP